MGATTPSLVFSATDSTAALQISDSDRSPVSRPTRGPTCVRALSSRPSRSPVSTFCAASARPLIESVVEIRAVPIIHLGLQGTKPRIFRVETKTSEGVETASTMPARRLDLGLSNLSALFSNAEITSPIKTVGCMVSGGSPSTPSRSSAAATCPPLCGLILCVAPLGASHCPSAQDEVGHRPTEIPQTGWLQGCLDLFNLRRWREIPDLLRGGPALFTLLPDLHTYLVYVGDDLGGGLTRVVAGGPCEQRRLQSGRQKQCDPHHDGDHRSRQGAVA